MKIELKEIQIRDVSNGYIDNSEEGVYGFDGKLNIRPKYQREFVYKDKQRDSVIDTVTKNFPLNVMYWVKSDDDCYEVLDGQQRTISICQYVNGDFSYNKKYFHNLTKDKQDEILNYKLMIYICEGTDSEKLDWFRTINIAGEKLTDQELRNAVYAGPWTTEAKKYFSKTSCPAYQIASDYLKGTSIRQEYLETALRWITDRDSIEIEEYMARKQSETNATELWLYFQSVINWVKTLFTNYRSEQKGIEWGILYNKYKQNSYDPVKLEEKIKELMQDDDITKKSGIYAYLITGEEKHLNIRAFTPSMKREAYERQKGICPICNKHFEINEMEGDHITPWVEGGKTNANNCQMLCKECNRRKSSK